MYGKKIFGTLFLLWLMLFLGGCLTGDRKPVIEEDQKVNIEMKRYGRALFEIDRNNIGKELKRLSEDYYFFIGDSYLDTLSIIQISEFLYDPLNMEIAEYCLEKYDDTDSIQDALNRAFSYYRYYFPGAGIPRVYTYISGLNYESPVNLVDTVLIIALDMYLGPDFKPYSMVGIPFYQVRRMNAQSIVPDCFREIAYQRHSSGMKPETLLDNMIFHGKALLFLDLILPDTPDEILIGYAPEQYRWAEENESNLWAFLIENDLLYSTKYHEVNKLIQDGPFTSGFGKSSPAMLGRWLGWQIMKSYSEKHPEKTLEEIMMATDAAGILRDSGYRPGR
jgi:hypothetical protein